MEARLAAALCAVVVLAGCGSSSDEAASGPETATASSRVETTTRAPASDARAARVRKMKAVVRAWSRRLNAGDNRGVARLFALPAVVEQGPYGFRLRTRRQLAIWHASLPCSGKVVSITVEGRFATAVFELGDRPASTCDAPGSLAAARFEIVDGKIVAWVQVPVPSDAGQGNGPSA